MLKIVTAVVSFFFAVTVFAQVQQLDCNSNVKCNDKNDVVSKLRSTWIKMNSPSEPAKSYEDFCYQAMLTVKNFQFPIPADMVVAQLNQCNQGVTLIQNTKR